MLRITPFEAHIPEPYIVLGARLKPLTLGHAALMVRLGAGCWIDGGEVTVDALVAGVIVCSSDDYNLFKSDIYNGNLQGRIDQLSSTVSADDIDENAKVFAQYIEEGLRGPTVLFENTESATVRSHAIQSLRVQMMKFFRVPLSEVMNVTIASALWDLATLSEINQVGRIWTSEDDDLKRQADEFAEKWASKQNAGGANG